MLGLFVGLICTFLGNGLLGAQEQAPQPAAQESIASPEDKDGVTFEQILADPDNVDLNYRYARAEVKRGDLRGAVSALERVLAVNPNLHQVRLFYAVVLFRLGNFDDAQRELDILSELPMQADLRGEIEKYKKSIRLSRSRTLLTGRLSVGMEYDDNRNASPATGKSLFGDTQVVLNGRSLKREDTSIVSVAYVEARRDLGAQAGHELFGALTYYRSDQTAVRTLNLQAYSAQGGGVYKIHKTQWTGSLLFNHILLAQSTYLRSRGGSLKLEHKFSPRLNLYIEGKDVYQDFVPTTLVPLAAQRSGVEVTGSLGADYRLTPSMKAGLSYTHGVKHAQQNINAFNRELVSVNHVWLLGRGNFLYSYFDFYNDWYPHPDFFISSQYRLDRAWRAGFNYGMPLTFVHQALKDFTWTLNYEYYQSVSNIINYSYTNNKVQALLTYKWDLGL